MEALIGEEAANAADAIAVDGEPLGHANPTERRRRGMAFVPGKNASVTARCRR